MKDRILVFLQHVFGKLILRYSFKWWWSIILPTKITNCCLSSFCPTLFVPIWKLSLTVVLTGFGSIIFYPMNIRTFFYVSIYLLVCVTVLLCDTEIILSYWQNELKTSLFLTFKKNHLTKTNYNNLDLLSYGQHLSLFW